MVEPILLWNMSSVVAGLIFEFCNLIMPIPFLADLNRFLVTRTHARQNLDEAGGEKTRGDIKINSHNTYCISFDQTLRLLLFLVDCILGGTTSSSDSSMSSSSCSLNSSSLSSDVY
jgi:hypothetical protein